MTEQQKPPLAAAGAKSDMAALLAQGLADLHKAVKGSEFYPKGHPYRTEALHRAFEVLQRLVAQRPLLLTIDRRGFLLAAERVEGGPWLLQLARECLFRRITSIAFLEDLLFYDLESLVQLLSSDPHKSSGSGGVPRLLEETGSRTIWLNLRDIAAIRAKRGVPAGSAAAAEASPAEADGAAEAATNSAGVATAPGVPELLSLMARETADTRYQELGRELSVRLAEHPDEGAILPVLEELMRQHHDAKRSPAQREYAFFTLSQLADRSVDFLLGSLESKECRQKKEILRVLAALGAKGTYWIIQRLCVAKGVYERKSLAAALVAIGPSAIPPLLGMLKDERWYVVRNMVTILGELRPPDCVEKLNRPLYHSDERVRKETIRALSKIGGEEAESALIPLLEEQDEGLVRRVITSLGLMHSSQAVPAMLTLLARRDLLLKELPVKKELLVALGRIGDRGATGPLLKMLDAFGWPAPGKWQELKIAVAATLGQIGDDAALPTLSRIGAGKGPLAEACQNARDAIRMGLTGRV